MFPQAELLPKLPKKPKRQPRKAPKSGTPYSGSAANARCLVCGDTFRSSVSETLGKYTTLSARRQLEAHYVEKHAQGSAR